jgi:hypothetical protein
MSTPHQVADSSANPVNVLLPIYFDISGIDAKLFGERYDISGTVIRVREKLPVSSFYDQSGSLISYRQDTSEDVFEVDISGSYAARMAQDISSSLHIVEGSAYDITKRGISKLDASLVFLDANSAFTQYNSIQDFVLSYFANKVLGHPGALAAISNDSTIRTDVTTTFGADKIQTKLSSAAKEQGSMTDDDAKFIVQQIMNQDLARFNSLDKRADGFTNLPFAVGDKIYVQVRMSNNTYSLQGSLSNPTTITTGIVSPASLSATEGSGTAIPSENDQYLLEFMIGSTNTERDDY